MTYFGIEMIIFSPDAEISLHRRCLENTVMALIELNKMVVTIAPGRLSALTRIKYKNIENEI